MINNIILEIIETWDCDLGDGNYDLIKYSRIYREIDCKVLMDGYEVFRKWINDLTELDVYTFITIQSLASTFMLNSGCYDNVYKFSGVIQQLIIKRVVGRVMCNSNKQYHVKKSLISMLAVYILLLCILCLVFFTRVTERINKYILRFIEQSRWIFCSY